MENFVPGDRVIIRYDDAVSELSPFRLREMGLKPENGLLSGLVIKANCGPLYTEKRYNLICFDDHLNFGIPYSELGSGYQKTIRESKLSNPEKRRYCGVSNDITILATDFAKSMEAGRTELTKKMKPRFKIGDEVFYKWDGVYKRAKVVDIPGNLAIEVDGKVLYHVPEACYSVDEVIKNGARVSIAKDDIIYSKAAPDNRKRHGEVIDSDYSSESAIVMFNEAENFGLTFEEMGPEAKTKIESLNIPNFDKRRYYCCAKKFLTFRFFKDSVITQTKEKTMANKIVETLKGDAKEAAYRVAGTQITNGVKMGLVKLFESKGGNSDQMEMLKGLLDSEIGDSLISLILGYGLSYAPHLKSDARVQKLSEEFRINGMATAGNAIVGAAMESILPVLTTALQALPEETSSNARISESSEEEEEDVAPPVKLSKTAG